jgi:hypothetical protein
MMATNSLKPAIRVCDYRPQGNLQLAVGYLGRAARAGGTSAVSMASRRYPAVPTAQQQELDPSRQRVVPFQAPGWFVRARGRLQIRQSTRQQQLQC